MIKDENLALEVDPFEGDFGDPEFVVLSDKIVSVRKSRPCSFCKRSIAQGERARAMSSVLDGEIARYTFCAECLNEMVDVDFNGKLPDELNERLTDGEEND